MGNILVQSPKSSEILSLTPMMQQYFGIKKDYKDALLFYRMGDFYELFFDDAVEAAAALDITLTTRGKHLGESIPMCGVPVHSHDSYLFKLIRSGFKVAICEQLEDPSEAKKRGAKSVVKRDVVRLITQGTLTEENLLDSKFNNALTSIACVRGSYGLSWVDLSTGHFELQTLLKSEIDSALSRIMPGEILLSESLYEDIALKKVFAPWDSIITILPSVRFNVENAQKRLEEMLSVKTLSAFGDFSQSEIAAAGAVTDYIILTQKGANPRLKKPNHFNNGNSMAIDSATRRNLELNKTLSGSTDGSLLSIIDKTLTGFGARLLSSRLAAPLMDRDEIEQRLDQVDAFYTNHAVLSEVRALIKLIPDSERCLARIIIGRGRPRDVTLIRELLHHIPEIKYLLSTSFNSSQKLGPWNIFKKIINDLGEHQGLLELLLSAIADEVPVFIKDGGFIRSGYSDDLDDLNQLRDHSKNLIVDLQLSYVKETGVQTLKVRHNNVHGYYVEVPSRSADRLLQNTNSDYGGTNFMHRQTMTNAVRFSTIELVDLDGRIRSAANSAQLLEQTLFEDLIVKIIDHAEAIVLSIDAIATIDVAASMAQLAIENNYTRPELYNNNILDIQGGRHPVVEAAIRKKSSDSFITNDCQLGETTTFRSGRLWLLTGPNMAGKSTFLRQNALIVLMAQMGSFVPADSAQIGIVDRLFSRVGAADDLARGQSTFMVEMVETASILNQATNKSLVILDEIGRGTSTFDGLSIAWAVVEYLHNKILCRSIFATHYHELTILEGQLDSLSAHHLAVKEWKDDVIFLHTVALGVAGKSYGIHVAGLAGLPIPVLRRAKAVLSRLETDDKNFIIEPLADAVSVFEDLEESTLSTEPDLVTELTELNLDDMTPNEALNILYRLQSLTKGGVQ